MAEPDELQLIIGQAALCGLFAVDVRCGEIQEFTESIRKVFAAEKERLCESVRVATESDAESIAMYRRARDRAETAEAEVARLTGIIRRWMDHECTEDADCTECTDLCAALDAKGEKHG